MPLSQNIQDNDLEDHEPAGYAALVRRFALRCLPHHDAAYIAPVHRRETRQLSDGRVLDIYPPPRRPRDGVVGHLVFALRYEGSPSRS